MAKGKPVPEVSTPQTLQYFCIKIFPYN